MTTISISYAADSLWVKLGGEGFSTRVVDGKLQIKAHSAMLGYLNAPAPFTEDGWFETGDVVEERDGWMRILGRESELINVGGEKVYPAEVDASLSAHAAVEDAATIGVPHERKGEEIVSVVVLREGEIGDPQLAAALIDFCRERLPEEKCPARIDFVDRLPRRETGQMLRRVLRDRYRVGAVSLPISPD